MTNVEDLNKKPTMFSVWKNHWKKTTLGISQNVNNFVPKEQSVSKQDQQKCQPNIVTIFRHDQPIVTIMLHFTLLEHQ